MESSGKWEKKEKWEDGDIWVYVCGGEKSREKKKEKKRKHMDDRKEERKNNIKKKKWQFRNFITIFSK